MVEVLRGHRVVANRSSLDSAKWPDRAVVLRIAPDDALVFGGGTLEVVDEHAIVEPDGGFCGVRMTEEAVIALLGHIANWRLPDSRPCLAQGMLAGLPVKIWVNAGAALLITPTPFAAELEDRLS